MSLESFLNWLVSPDGGAFILVSWALSWFLEGYDFWEELKSKVKSLIIVGVAIVLGILATWLGTRPDIVAAVDPYFTTVSYVVMVWLTTQTAHRLNVLRRKGGFLGSLGAE